MLVQVYMLRTRSGLVTDRVYQRPPAADILARDFPDPDGRPGWPRLVPVPLEMERGAPFDAVPPPAPPAPPNEAAGPKLSVSGTGAVVNRGERVGITTADVGSLDAALGGVK